MLYQNKEIKALLSNYNKLPHEQKMDLDVAFSKEIISYEMAQLVYLHYHHGFSLMTTGKLMRLNLKEVLELNDEMLETIEALLNGYRSPVRKSVVNPFSNATVPDGLLAKDELGREVLRQRKEGKPEYIADDYTTRAIDENADGFELDRFLINERHNNSVISLHEGV